MSNKVSNKVDDQLLCLCNYIIYLICPFVCLTYTNQEIAKFIKYKKYMDDATSKEYNNRTLEEVIKKITSYTNSINWNNDLYNLYLPDNEIIKIYEFIVIHYNFKDNCLLTDEIKEDFKIIKKIVYNLLSKRKFNNEDINVLYKKLSWIIKLLTIDEKNKLFDVLELPKDKIFDKQSATNLICHTMVEECMKLNKYPKYKFVNTRYYIELCDNDQKLINPILNYIKQNPKCVELPDFKNTEQIEDFKTFKMKDESFLNQPIFNIKNFKKAKDKDYILKSFIRSNINNFSATYVWVCYLNAVIYSLMDIKVFKEFINNEEYLKYIADDKQNESKIKYSLCYNIQHGNVDNIVKILKSYYPKKYHFLGFTNVLIQPYIIFIDILNIITKEIKDNKIINLFEFVDKKNNKKLVNFINKKEQEVINNIPKNIKKTSAFLTIAINNNVKSLDQENEELNKKEEYLKYPLVMRVNNENYYLLNCIIFNKTHHYSYIPLFTYHEEALKYFDNENLVEKKLKVNDYHQVVHMIIYTKETNNN